MKIVTGRPRTGKTHHLIKQSAKEWLYIACFNRNECLRVSKEAKEMGLDIPLPITFEELLHENVGNTLMSKGVLIDNAEMLIDYVCKVPINTMVIST